ncbi:MAG TPA: hypothetical protein VGO59_13785 [Verrucomicrobiae bacterium]
MLVAGAAGGHHPAMRPWLRRLTLIALAEALFFGLPWDGAAEAELPSARPEFLIELHQR